MIYKDLNRLDESSRWFKKSIEAASKNVSGAIEIGRIYAAQGKIEEALNVFKKILAQRPDNVKAYIETEI